MSQTKIDELLAAEYELQHYTFTIEDLKESFRELLDQKIHEVTDTMITTIVNKNSDSKSVADKLRDCRDDLSKDIAKDCRAKLPELDQLLTDIFSVPPHVLLTDETQQVAYQLSDRELKELEIKCAEYEKSCQTNKILIAQMNEELNTYMELKTSGFFDKTATTIELADEVLSIPLDVNRLADALDKMKQMNV